MTTGRINQVAAMRASVCPTGADADAQSTDPRPAARAGVFRIQFMDNRETTEDDDRSKEPCSPTTIERLFSVRLSSTRCGVEMIKTAESLA
jgi:hypothetical protein